MRALGPGVLAFALVLSVAPIAAAPPALLLESIERDSSFKVRMQAIRVLDKKIKDEGLKVDDRIITVLGAAATKDESHLVRGLASFVLGNLRDPRAAPVLAVAVRDENPFVQAQAQEALTKIPKEGPPEEPAPSGKRSLVIAIDASAAEIGRDLDETLRSQLENHLKNLAGADYAVGDQKGKGFKLSGTIASLSASDGGGGETRVSAEVKVTVLTWPENNLRHVLSAKASAKAKVQGAALEKLKKKVLEAAVQRAAVDAMQQLAAE